MPRVIATQCALRWGGSGIRRVRSRTPRFAALAVSNHHGRIRGGNMNRRCHRRSMILKCPDRINDGKHKRQNIQRGLLWDNRFHIGSEAAVVIIIMVTLVRVGIIVAMTPFYILVKLVPVMVTVIIENGGAGCCMKHGRSMRTDRIIVLRSIAVRRIIQVLVFMVPSISYMRESVIFFILITVFHQFNRFWFYP